MDVELFILAVVTAIGMGVFPDVFAKLSEALLIASILGLTIDQYLRRWVIQDVATGVGLRLVPYLIEHTLPKEFVEEMVFIKSISFLRKDVEMKFWFREIENDPRHLKVDAEVRYTVVNYGDHDPIDFEHRVNVLGGESREPNRILSVGAKGEDLTGGEYDYEFKDVKDSFTQVVKVPPNKEKPKNRFWGVTRRILEAEGSEVIFLRDPCLEVEVEVIQSPGDLEVEVYFGHRKGADRARRVRNTWKLSETALLPWAAVYILWHRKTKAPLV